MRPTGEHKTVSEIEPGDWFDLNSGNEDGSLPVRVLSMGDSPRAGLTRVEFVTTGGDTGEAHLPSDLPVALMAVYDFEDEEG